MIDNSGEHYQIIAEGVGNNEEVLNEKIWKIIKKEYYGK